MVELGLHGPNLKNHHQKVQKNNIFSEQKTEKELRLAKLQAQKFGTTVNEVVFALIAINFRP